MVHKGNCSKLPGGPLTAAQLRRLGVVNPPPSKPMKSGLLDLDKVLADDPRTSSHKIPLAPNYTPVPMEYRYVSAFWTHERRVPVIFAPRPDKSLTSEDTPDSIASTNNAIKVCFREEAREYQMSEQLRQIRHIGKVTVGRLLIVERRWNGRDTCCMKTECVGRNGYLLVRILHPQTP